MDLGQSGFCFLLEISRTQFSISVLHGFISKYQGNVTMRQKSILQKRRLSTKSTVNHIFPASSLQPCRHWGDLILAVTTFNHVWRDRLMFSFYLLHFFAHRSPQSFCNGAILMKLVRQRTCSLGSGLERTESLKHNLVLKWSDLFWITR